MSAKSIASPRSAMNAAKPSSSSSRKPSSTSNGSGCATSRASVSRSAMDASRASTGLIT